MPIRSVTVGALAALAAVQVDAAVDCTGKNIEWDIQYQTDGYKYDEAAGTTTFCYTVGYKTAIDTADPLCSPAGGTPNPLTILGARFESCFTNENAGLRDEEGSWVPAPNDEGYVAETMGGDNEFNGDQWTTALPAVGSTGTYCATIRRKLNVSPTPNTAFLLGNNDRYSVVQVQGPECYLAPTSSTTEPPSTTTTPPPTTTTVPPPTTTTVPPPPTTTTPPPPTTTVPPPPTTTTIPPPTTTTTVSPPPTTTTVPPEPSATYPAPEEILVVTSTPSASAAAKAAAPSASGVNVGAVVGAGVGAGVVALAAGAFIYRRRMAAASTVSQEEVVA